MAPIVHGLESQYADRMNFVYLDIDDPANDSFKEALDYWVQPHIFLLDEEGNILNEWLGPVTEQEFVEAFEVALAQ
jgi:hypothetical protein